MSVRRLMGVGCRVTIAAGLLVLPAGCGNGEEAAETKAPRPAASAPAPRLQPPAVDACALLTSAEAGAALGMPMGAPVRSDVPPLHSCTYQGRDASNSLTVTVTSYTDVRQAYDAYLMAVKINDYEEFKGLGDRAYTSPISDVHVLKGRYEMSVDVSQSIDKDEQVKKAREIAARALDRLPK